MAGIKETKEAIVGLMKLGAVIGKQTKDGAQLADFAALIAEYNSNAEFKAALDLAYADIEVVPEEIKDLDFAESLELGMAVLKELPGLIESLKA